MGVKVIKKRMVKNYFIQLYELFPLFDGLVELFMGVVKCSFIFLGCI